MVRNNKLIITKADSAKQDKSQHIIQENATTTTTAPYTPLVSTIVYYSVLHVYYCIIYTYGG